LFMADSLSQALWSPSHVPVAGDDVRGGGQLPQTHRPPGVQLLSGDTDLGSEAELLAVGEPGGGIDHHGRRVCGGGETLCGWQ
jgi:hypothetical protein